MYEIEGGREVKRERESKYPNTKYKEGGVNHNIISFSKL